MPEGYRTLTPYYVAVETPTGRKWRTVDLTVREVKLMEIVQGLVKDMAPNVEVVIQPDLDEINARARGEGDYGF